MPASGLGNRVDYFSDDDDSVHERHINQSAAAGFTSGTGAGYSPDDATRRDQIATFIVRVLDLLIEEGTAVPGR